MTCIVQGTTPGRVHAEMFARDTDNHAHHRYMKLGLQHRISACRTPRTLASKGYRPYVHETSYLLAFAWLQVTRSARGPRGPRADRVTCNHAKANSNLSSAQGRYLACFTRSRYEHKMRSNLAPCFTLTFQFEDVMC